MPLNPNNLPLIDAHVHMVGNGLHGSGCQLLAGKGLKRWLAALMLHRCGLPKDALTQDLESLYLQKILSWVHASQIDQVVLLANDLPYTTTGTPLSAAWMYVPNSYILNLAKKHPEILPAVSIHPARPDALDELEACASQGAAVLKLLPNCHNVNCSLPQYTRFWTRLRELGIPLLAHTGGEMTLPVLDASLANPTNLTLPLELGVNVIAAHCSTNSGPFDPDYFSVFQNLLQKFSNLYGDTSAMIHPFRSKALKTCLLPELLPRLIHGSDLPVPPFPLALALRGLLPFKSISKLSSNLLQNDFALKTQIGIPKESASRIHSLLPPTATNFLP